MRDLDKVRWYDNLCLVVRVLVHRSRTRTYTRRSGVRGSPSRTQHELATLKPRGRRAASLQGESRPRNLLHQRATEGSEVDPLVELSIVLVSVGAGGTLLAVTYGIIRDRTYEKLTPVQRTKDPNEFLEPLTTGGTSAERKLKAEFKKRRLLPMPRAPKKAAQRIHRSIRKARMPQKRGYGIELIDEEKFSNQLGELK